MDIRAEYIFQPSTLISLISAIVSVAVAWTALKGRIDSLEQDMKEIKSLDLDSRLTRMETDIQWIRSMLEKKW